MSAAFDLVSGGELRRVLAAGGEARRSVFAGVGKSAAYASTAIAMALERIPLRITVRGICSSTASMPAQGSS